MWTSKSMSLEQWSHTFSIAGVLLALISIVLVLIELQEHNKITRAENAQKLVELTMMSNLALVKDSTLASIWTNGNVNYDLLSNEDRPRFRRLWIIYLNILANAFSQMENGLIDKDEFQSWDNDIEKKKVALSKIWDPELSMLY